MRMSNIGTTSCATDLFAYLCYDHGVLQNTVS